jgi:hypothetical protein
MLYMTLKFWKRFRQGATIAGLIVFLEERWRLRRARQARSAAAKA